VSCAVVAPPPDVLSSPHTPLQVLRLPSNVFSDSIKADLRQAWKLSGRRMLLLQV
jgi:hypothetical protein